MEVVGSSVILTIGEVVQLLKLSDDAPITSAIKSGSLPVLRIGADIRVIGRDLNDFLLTQRSISGNGMLNGNHSSKQQSTLRKGMELKITKISPFRHRWPDNTEERFRDALGGSIKTSSGVHAIKIGFTKRNAAGKERERGVVIIDGRPIVEFCGADDFDKSNTLASVIKINNRQVKPIQGVPLKYSHLKVGDYQAYVSGPYASSNLAVYCTKGDVDTMVEHALLRLEDMETRKTN